MPSATALPRFVASALLALSSAVLLVCAFPLFSQPWCAWVALVPLLLLVRRTTARGAFWWSAVAGFVFFLGSMSWLIHVTLGGWILLCLYLALYVGAFGLLAHRMPASPWVPLGVLPAAWVALEYLRSHLLSGFGWNLLAYSQTPWTPVIQLADLTGPWGVSCLLVLVNVALAHALARARGARRTGLVAALAVLAALGYGSWRLRSLPDGPAVTAAVLQGNIPQAQKWDEAYTERILAQYERLTREASAGQPQLIIWPETSVPGYLGLEEALTQRVIALAREGGVPLLVGAPMGRLRGTAWELTNSAVLVDAGGALEQRYEKLHLVPFGEMVPFEQALGWVRRVLPPIGEFSPGRDATVFRLEPLPPFSALICFEDVFPDLARRFVRQGARWLVVITNDAWFGPSAAAYQHAQASVFRAVELRVPVARAANTGWSGCIDAAGRPLGSVADAHGAELFVPGMLTCEIPAGPGRSLYLAWGDWFAWLGLAVTAGWLMRALRFGRSPTRSS